MIKAIIFDCFGVLIESSEAELKRLCPADRQETLRDIRLQRDRGYINYTEYLSALSDVLGIPVDEVKAITETLHVRNRELFDYLESIDRTRYKIGLLSNIGDRTMDQLFTREETDRFFDAMVLSYQVGMVKPEPGVYHLMATRLGLTPEECILVDDVERNCVAAEQEGMLSILHHDAVTTVRKLRQMAT